MQYGCSQLGLAMSHDPASCPFSVGEFVEILGAFGLGEASGRNLSAGGFSGREEAQTFDRKRLFVHEGPGTRVQPWVNMDSDWLSGLKVELVGCS